MSRHDREIIMKQKSIFDHISKLVAEEVVLRERQIAPLSDHRRIRHLQSELGECWDLLREQRARPDVDRADQAPPPNRTARQ